MRKQTKGATITFDGSYRGLEATKGTVKSFVKVLMIAIEHCNSIIIIQVCYLLVISGGKAHVIS